MAEPDFARLAERAREIAAASARREGITIIKNVQVNDGGQAVVAGKVRSAIPEGV